MNLKKTIPFAISIILLAGLASANRGTFATPQADAPKPGPSASAQPKEKPKPTPKKPPADEGGW